MYIAEIGWNFMGDMKLAEEMILSAAYSGATHVKFQYWREENLKPGPWDEDGRRQIYISAQLDKDKINLISHLANKYKVIPFFSVFNDRDAKVIKDLGFGIIKIPSMEVTNIKLINYCLDNFQTIYFSAGACTTSEFENFSKLINKTKNKVILMHCVSCYPCLPENANLGRLKLMSKICPNITLGLSDHTSSTVLPAVAASFNAVAIEKHFTTNRNLPGRDNKFALLPKDFEAMVRNHKEALKGLIDHGLDYQECEKETVENYRGRWNH
jgi:sialic acid synthase SpsE